MFERCAQQGPLFEPSLSVRRERSAECNLNEKLAPMRGRGPLWWVSKKMARKLGAHTALATDHLQVRSSCGGRIAGVHLARPIEHSFLCGLQRLPLFWVLHISPDPW